MSTPSDATPQSPQRPPGGIPIGRAAVLFMLAVTVMLAAVVGTIWHSQAALPWLLNRVPGLQVQDMHGSLAGGELRAASLEWDLPHDAGRLHIEGLAIAGLGFDWRPHPGAWVGLRVEALRARAVHFRSGAAPAAPTPAPTDLRLPFALRAELVSVDQVDLDGLPPLHGLAARVLLGAEHGASHRIENMVVEVERLRLAGSLVVGADAPLPTSLHVDAASREGGSWAGSLQASGALARLQVQAQVRDGIGARPSAALQASAQVQPWAPWPLDVLQVETRGFDLASLSTRLPETALDGRAVVTTQGLDVPAQATAELTNARPGRIDEGRLPISRLSVDASAVPRQPQRVELRRFELRWSDAQGEAGRTSGRGYWHGDTLDLDLQLADLQPARIDGRSAPLRVAGPLRLRVDGLQPGPGQAPRPRADFAGTLTGRTLDGSGVPVTLELDAQLRAGAVELRRAVATAGEARASLAGSASRLAAGWRLQAEAELRHFDPLPWWRGAEDSAWRRGPHRLEGHVDAKIVWHDTSAKRRDSTPAHWLERVEGSVDLVLEPSVLAAAPLAGKLHFERTPTRLALHGGLLSAGNQVDLDTVLGGLPADDRWRLRVNASALDTLAPLTRLASEFWPHSAPWLPGAGTVTAEVQLDGRWPSLRGSGTVAARGVRSAAGGVDALDLRLRIEPGADAEPSLTASLGAQGVQRNGQRLDRLELDLDGTARAHTLRWNAESPLRPPAWVEPLIGPTGSGTRLQGQARGQWAKPPGQPGRWQLGAGQLRASARDAAATTPWLLAQNLGGEVEFDVDGAPNALRLDPGRLTLGHAAARWQTAQWQLPTARGRLSAELEAIDVAALLGRVQPEAGWTGDLSLAGRIEVRSDEQLDADVVLERTGGDLALVDDSGTRLPLGVSELRLALGVHDGVWRLAQGVAGRRLGEMSGAQVVQPLPGRRWPGADSPLQGVIEARVARLGAWGQWTPVGWRLAGSLDARATFAGTLGAPEFSGRITGRELGLRNVLEGVHLSDGELELTLTGDHLRLDRLALRGGDGWLELTGEAELGARPTARLLLDAQRLLLLGRIDRRLVTSGRAELKLDPQALWLDGRFDVDEGLIDFSRGDAPELDSDVKVRPRAGPPVNGSAAAGTQAPLPAHLRNSKVALTVGLGERLRIRGRGLDTTLRGELRLTSPGGRPALEGVVQAVDGTYAAYGQNLEIQRGEITFSGPIDDPRLDVLAIRPNLEVLAGVSVTGTAQLPRVRLYSDPEMPDADKLSWLMLGRGPEGLGSSDSALLQSAAVALLAGEGKAPNEQLMGALGLTQFSVRNSSTTGDTRDTIVSLGTQLSKNWYVGYERSLNSTTGTWQLIYRLAQRFTVRAQWGEDTSLDLIRTWRWN